MHILDEPRRPDAVIQLDLVDKDLQLLHALGMSRTDDIVQLDVGDRVLTETQAFYGTPRSLQPPPDDPAGRGPDFDTALLQHAARDPGQHDDQVLQAFLLRHRSASIRSPSWTDSLW